MTKRILVFAKRNDSAAKNACQQLVSYLKSKKIESFEVKNGDDTIPEAQVKKCDLAVVIGGDGTFLNLVKRLPKKDALPIIGINLGTVGFITEFSPKEMLQAVDRALSGKLVEDSRTLLSVSLWRGKKCVQDGIVFNDVVINKDTRTSLAIMDVFLSGLLLSHVRADGYIVATATGSTGYALSAGGPLLHPGIGGMVLAPICPHSLSSRPVVVPQEAEVEIQVKQFAGIAYLVFDGQINVEIKESDCVKISKSDTTLRILRSPKHGWAEVVREKLQMI